MLRDLFYSKVNSSTLHKAAKLADNVQTPLKLSTDSVNLPFHAYALTMVVHYHSDINKHQIDTTNKWLCNRQLSPGRLCGNDPESSRTNAENIIYSHKLFSINHLVVQTQGTTYSDTIMYILRTKKGLNADYSTRACHTINTSAGECDF